MKKRYWALGALGLGGIGLGAVALIAAPEVHDGNKGDAPELARAGGFPTGTSTHTLTSPDRAIFSQIDLATGSVSKEDRTIAFRAWYPASPGSSQRAVYTHDMTLPSGDIFEVEWQGKSTQGASALEGMKFPLVIVSHGFGGWSTQLSNLAEHVASHGYIVVSIEHADEPVTGIPSFLKSFGNVLQSRSADQREVIAHVLGQAGSDPVFAAIDAEKIAIIGYSMGGYGALTTAGARYNFGAGPVANLADPAREVLAAQPALDADLIDAVVAIAPWGGQQENQAWSAKGLEGVKAPALLIAGSQDDVVGFKDGVKWIFENLSATDRHMLVYQNARHNIAGNAFQLGPEAPFTAIEFLTEPVWRGDRMNAINQHFVTAFLNLHLKDDTDAARFLDVPTKASVDSVWETGLGEQLNGKFAGAEESGHWQGFQKRWAVGLEIHSRKAGGGASAGTTGADAPEGQTVKTGE